MTTTEVEMIEFYLETYIEKKLDKYKDEIRHDDLTFSGIIGEEIRDIIGGGLDELAKIIEDRFVKCLEQGYDPTMNVQIYTKKVFQ